MTFSLRSKPASHPRERGEETLPRAAAPFLHFARLLRADGFVVAPEQVSAFMAGVTLLGPRSMGDIREAALATLAPPPDRRAAFEALFRVFFHGEGTITVEGGEEDEETVVKDDAAVREEEMPVLRDEESGAAASALEQLGTRTFVSDAARLDAFQRALPAALPQRRSFRYVRTHAGGRLDLRRSLRAAVAADGDVPAPMLRRRQTVARPLLILIDVSGSMKEHTQDYLRLAHAAVQAAPRAEIFTFGTRLTRVTAALRIRDAEQALARAAALVDDWDGGTRIGPALLALLSIPRFAAFARGAAVIVLSDGLERGGHAEMELAMRRLSARAFRLSLATPLAGDPRFAPRTAALQAILPVLDDLVDGSSVAVLAPFILSLARPAPAAATVWRRIA
ncbi:vWA domain-containing protein [Ollibium composti]|uniref:VWA domain-containing protein n=1 Tax=Ollibium composti TaxID=2675109 RepID=A0ABY2Q2J2_9HYPH|nr:VWA domain-containing protein [Mesorhizobium composti]THF54901.1 VWA domain-containing protein [Mesorhizobium composti]